MSEQENTAAMKRIYEDIINGGNINLADQLIDEKLVEFETLPGLGQGREGFKKYWTMLRSAVPDLKIRIDSMNAQGDDVVSRITITGTHKGDFMGAAGSGQKLESYGLDIVRFANGKMVEHRGNTVGHFTGNIVPRAAGEWQKKIEDRGAVRSTYGAQQDASTLGTEKSQVGMGPPRGR